MIIYTVSTTGLPQQRWCSCLIPEQEGYLPGCRIPHSDAVIYLGNEVGKNLRWAHVLAEYGQPKCIAAPGTHDVANSDHMGQGHAPPEIYVTAEVDGEAILEDLSWETIDHDFVRTVYHSRERITGTMWAINAYFYVWADHPVGTLELEVICSNPELPNLEASIDRLTISCSDPLFPRWAKYRDIPLELRDAIDEVVLFEDETFADGQGQAYVMEVVNLDKVNADNYASIANIVHGPAYAAATYRGRQWGPLGFTPIMDTNKGILAARREHRRWWDLQMQQGNRWSAPTKGLNLRPADTGAQQDFGYTALVEALASCDGILNVDEAYCMALKESCRPNTYLDKDAQPIHFPVEGLVFWGDTKHWHSGVSPNRLGKELPTVQMTRGWLGRDWEHCSANHLVGTYALTGSYLLRDQLMQFSNAFLFGCTTNKGWSTTDRGEARSIGRRAQVLAWLDWLFDMPVIRTRAMDRLASSYEDLLANIDEDGEIRDRSRIFCIKYHGKDPKWFGGQHRFWMPWQQAFVVLGFYMQWKQIKNDRFLAIAKAAADTYLRYAWGGDGESWWTFSAIRDLERPPTEDELNDKDIAVKATGTDFDLWGWPAVAIARALLDTDSAMVEKAERILDFLSRRKQRELDKSQGFVQAQQWELQI